MKNIIIFGGAGFVKVLTNLNQILYKELPKDESITM